MAGSVCGRNPVSRSLLGAKRTCSFALHMSAYDPKRTFASGSYAFPLGAQSVPIHQLTRTPAHFPEFNFEPCGFLEDRNQLGLAGGRRIGIGKALQMRPRFSRDRLVGRTGIFGDPLAIEVRFDTRFGPRGKPRRD